MTDLTTEVTVTIHGTEIDLIAVGDADLPRRAGCWDHESAPLKGASLLFADGTPIPVDLHGLIDDGRTRSRWCHDALDEALARGDFES